MMQQYWDIRRTLSPDTLLLFRLGDFYEMFEDDAQEGARLLGITLTNRNGQPMAGIPYHAADNYISKVLAAGKKVAICDQVGTPAAGKLVKRALTRILTPGTTLETHQLDEKKSHYLLAINHNPKLGILAAWLDLSTGDFNIAQEKKVEDLLPVLTAIDPREVLLPEHAWERWEKEGHHFCEVLEGALGHRPRSEMPEYQFDLSSGAQKVMETLGVLNLEGFGIEKNHPALGVGGAVLAYATENLCASPENIRRVSVYHCEGTLLLDPATLRNLEVFKSASNTRKGSLIEAMDHTVTAAGARLLEHYLANPQKNLTELKRRQECVRYLHEDIDAARNLQDALKYVRDLVRILSRMQNRIRNPRELGGIRETLNQLPKIKTLLRDFAGREILELDEQIGDFAEMKALLNRAINETLPSDLKEGGVICSGYDEELDRLRNLSHDNKTWLADLEREEQARTGIKNLKIKYNGAFGYFIEVTKSNIALVPENYIRKQTMTNAERYYTEELKQKEKEILNAEEKSIAKEEALFRELVEEILKEAETLKDTAHALAQVDLYAGWAIIAEMWNYTCPALDNSYRLEIEQGRHPVVEQIMREERLGLAGTHAFVPNDTQLDAGDEQIALITGPNMAGKSTFIRQVALIALMAHVGAWVPAKRCQMGLVDRIFSRIGASDELSRGNSTFMVEMNETANILNNATERSLIILDEIGRGTSTYDGLSIAWAVVEHLHGDANRGPRTLFATHYHELTQLETTLNRLSNYSVSVKEWNDQIIFVRQVIKGAADRSYGIQVARLAGLPQPVIDRAKIILEELESDRASEKEHVMEKKTTTPKADQLELFV